MNDMILQFKKKISQDTCVTGPFMKTSDPAFVEIAGYAGFDFVILDLEHGPVSVEGLQNLIRAAQCACILPVVRVPGLGCEIISKVLDIGALGIQVPQIASASDVKSVIKAVRFAPKGLRGVCRFVRAAGYSAVNRYEYFRNSDDILIVIQLEGVEAIEKIDEILEVEGIDIIFIGPYDLSQSVGYTGQIDHPLVEEKMMRIIEKAKKAGKSIGTFADTVEYAQKWKLKGIRYISYSVDVGLFYEYCRQIVRRIGNTPQE